MPRPVCVCACVRAHVFITDAPVALLGQTPGCAPLVFGDESVNQGARSVSACTPGGDGLWGSRGDHGGPRAYRLHRRRVNSLSIVATWLAILCMSVLFTRHQKHVSFFIVSKSRLTL